MKKRHSPGVDEWRRFIPARGGSTACVQLVDPAARVIPARGGINNAPVRHHPATPGGCQHSLTHSLSVSGANSLSGVVARELSGLMRTEEASHDPDTVATGVATKEAYGGWQGRRLTQEEPRTDPLDQVDLALFGRYARFVDYPSVDDSGTSGIDQARRGRFAEHHASATPVSVVGALRVAERHRQGVRQGQARSPGRLRCWLRGG